MLWTVVVLAGLAAGSPVYRQPLGPDLVLFWQVDYHSEQVRLELHLPGGPWLAIGFSDHGLHTQADYCFFHPQVKHRLQNIWTDDKGILHMDGEQDCRDFKVKFRGNETVFSFKREFDTCHPNHYIIQRGTTHIVWAMGTGPVPGSIMSAHHLGMQRVELLKPERSEVRIPTSGTWALTVTADKVAVPDLETTYWCHVQRVPSAFNKKHHIIRFEPVITGGNEHVVHHMELFHCEVESDSSVPLYRGACNSPERPTTTQKCKKVLAAWAMGATPFIYPQQAGLPIGGNDFNLHVMLEIHYNNPDRLSGLIDSSGIKVEVTSKLRRYDAGVIELGLEYIDKMAIPPGQPSFPLTGYCIAECTQVSVPEGGVMIFGSQLHTHLTGIRVATKHVRAGVELEELNRDNHYSTHFQEIRILKHPVLLLPGDALLTTCWYDTHDRVNVTLGGFAITDEMCVNYIYYYPKIDLEVCKSSISDQSLELYFDTLRRMEHQKCGSELPISDSYRSIEWSPVRVEILNNLYKESTIYMQCNRSSGERFPGNWEEMQTTIIHDPLPIAKRKCSTPFI